MMFYMEKEQSCSDVARYHCWQCERYIPNSMATLDGFCGKENKNTPATQMACKDFEPSSWAYDYDDRR